MCLGYQSEIRLKEVYAKGFEDEISQRVADIAGFLKKEYKKITGSTVALTEEGEIDVRVENSSRVRSWVTAKMLYKVGGLSSDMNNDNDGSVNTVEEGWKTFLDQGGWDGPRPSNDTRSKKSGE